LRQKKQKHEDDLEKSPDSSSEVPFFDRYADGGSPFDIQTEEEETEDVMATNGVRFLSFSSRADDKIKFSHKLYPRHLGPN
jgi:hypothetical protein